MSGEFTVDDAGGTPGAAPGGAPVTLDYFRQKAIEFQEVVNALDGTGRTIRELLVAIEDPQLAADLREAYNEFDRKKSLIRATAESVNLAAAGLNLIGVQTPRITIPQTLGAAPIVVSAVAAAAIFTAASLIIWGREWIAGVNQRLNAATVIGAVPEADRAKVAQAVLQTQAAVAETEQSPVVAIAGTVKWIALAAIAYFAWQAYSRYQGN